MALRAKKYFKDFEVQVTTDEKGRTKRTYVYRGDWYVRKVSERKHKLERICYVAFSIAAAALLVLAMLRPVSLNRGGFFAAVSILALVPAFCLIESSIEAFFKKGKLMKNQYQERLVMLRIMALIGSLLCLILSVGFAVKGIGDIQDRIENMKGFACSLIAAVMYGIVAVNEFMVKYAVIKAPPRPINEPDDSNEETRKYYD